MKLVFFDRYEGIEILRYFEPISKDIVPSHSLLKEFLGGGDFKG